MTICHLLATARRVYIYGMGSSGIASYEVKLRFMRLGLVCEAITDDHMLKMNRVLIDKTCLVIGISISGKTESVMSGLKQAKQAGAKTILMTSSLIVDTSYCDEVVQLATLSSLEQGNIISPQFPILVVVDIFYAFYMHLDHKQHKAIFNTTLHALHID